MRISECHLAMPVGFGIGKRVEKSSACPFALDAVWPFVYAKSP